MRIAISGSQCIGKTTLCDDIVKTWTKYKKSPNTYRTLVKEKNLPTSKLVTRDGQRQILDSMLEECKRFRKGDKVIFDRCAIDNIVYSLWSMDKGVSDIDKAFINDCIATVKEAMKHIDIVFFIPITQAAPIQLEERVAREIDQEYIVEIDNIFKAVAHQHAQDKSLFFDKDDAPPIIEIFGSREERIELLKYYLDVDGDLIETQSSVLDVNNMQDMEQLLREQREQFVIDNKDTLIKKGIIGDKTK